MPESVRTSGAGVQHSTVPAGVEVGGHRQKRAPRLRRPGITGVQKFGQRGPQLFLAQDGWRGRPLVGAPIEEGVEAPPRPADRANVGFAEVEAEALIVFGERLHEPFDQCRTIVEVHQVLDRSGKIE